MVKGIMQYYRVDEWYSSKIPLSIAMFIYVCSASENSLTKKDFTKYIIFYAVFWICFFAFNYLYNDFVDIEKDKNAGKIKIIQSVNPKLTLVSLIGLFVVSMGCTIVFFSDNWLIFGVGLISYILGMAYSAKGIRLKERGIFGVIECSFAQRNTPILMLLVMIPMKSFVFICWMCIVFANGLRYILVHQLLDKKNDLKTGIVTFVTKSRLPIKTFIVFILAFEVLLLAILFWDIIMSVYGAIFIAAYGLICLLNHLFIKKVLNQSYMFSFANFPLEDLYNVFLPMILAISYGVNNDMCGLIVVTVAYLCVPMLKKLGMPLMCLWKIITGELVSASN